MLAVSIDPVCSGSAEISIREGVTERGDHWQFSLDGKTKNQGSCQDLPAVTDSAAAAARPPNVGCLVM